MDADGLHCSTAGAAAHKFEATPQVVKAAKEGKVCEKVIGSVGEEKRSKERIGE
jgi:hypothetical protein